MKNVQFHVSKFLLPWVDFQEGKIENKIDLSEIRMALFRECLVASKTNISKKRIWLKKTLSKFRSSRPAIQKKFLMSSDAGRTKETR